MNIWNSKLMGIIENFLVNLTNYVWRKKREHEKKAIDKIKSKK